MYKVSRRTIERLIKRGTLPYHRIGRQIRLLPGDLWRVTCQPPPSNLDLKSFCPPQPSTQWRRFSD
jgi:excisionase family DNA binding protein